MIPHLSFEDRSEYDLHVLLDGSTSVLQTRDARNNLRDFAAALQESVANSACSVANVYSMPGAVRRPRLHPLRRHPGSIRDAADALLRLTPNSNRRSPIPEAVAGLGRTAMHTQRPGRETLYVIATDGLECVDLADDRCDFPLATTVAGNPPDEAAL
ncbi:MAG: hypothetical protein AAF658_12200, partial [Myxococcota bacterium]